MRRGIKRQPQKTVSITIICCYRSFMTSRKTEGKVAGQPVEEGKARIKLQRQLIAKLRADTGSTDLGRELLATLEAMQILDEINRLLSPLKAV